MNKKNKQKQTKRKMSSTRTLDSRYFRLLKRRVEGDYEYQSYQTLHAASTMVLFSKNCLSSPIAAVSFLPRSRGGNAKTVLTRRASSSAPGGSTSATDEYSLFQGLSNVDNDEFTFAVHNLTDFVRSPHVSTHYGPKTDIGYLKIDILGEKHKVQQVDLPKISVNQVNELRPSESVLIECDQRKSNRTMVLRGVVDQKTGSSVTVQEEDAIQEPELKKGTYFYISVLATSNFPEMVALFEETMWRATDVFVRRVPKYNGMSQSAIRNLQYGPEGSSMMFARGGRQYQDQDRGHTVQAFSRGGRQHQGQDRDGGHTVQAFSHGIAKGIDSLSNSSLGVARSRQRGQISAFSVQEQSMSVDCNESSIDRVMQESATPTTDEVLSSQVGKVVSGSQTIRVITGQTGHQYAYDKPGEKVCLGLSVWRDMRLLEPLTLLEAYQEAAMQLEDAVTNQSSKLLETLSKIYKEEKCAICFENEPSIVFLQCGHECVCEECCKSTREVNDAKKCFMCRSPIVAKVSTQAL